MKSLRSIFVSGLVASLPLVLTLYFVYWVIWSAESLLEGLFGYLLPPGWYVPGTGLLVTMGLVMLVGVLAQLWGIKQLLAWGESIMDAIPLVRTLFGTLRDFTALLSLDNKDTRLSRAVLVEVYPGARLIGLVTQADVRAVFPADEGELIAVYLPMSYQLGGYTLYLPRNTVESLDLSAEEAMRLAVTGGVSSK